MNKPFNFQEQLAIGEKGEAFLDAHFSERYDITPATRDEQRKGIDRHFVGKVSGAHLKVEYKTDAMARKTHNAFVEVTSVDKAQKSGWAYTSQADYLVYYIPGDEMVYILRFTTLRQHMPSWAAKYPMRSALNEGYKTWGLLVPLVEFERIADHAYAV